MKILTVIFLFLLMGCSNSVEPVEPVEPDQYWISPLGKVFPVTAKWRRGTPILRGLIKNVSLDTLFNKKMRFIITQKDNPDSILSDTFGYMTLDETESKYFPEFPYKIEHDLVPDTVYNIYVAGDTISLRIANQWWYQLVEDK